MGLFDKVEHMAEEAAHQGHADSLIHKLTEEGEQLLENKTGGKFDSQIEKGGEMLEQQVEQRLHEL